jgi:type II secretory pathway pseudopilin PulG
MKMWRNIQQIVNNQGGFTVMEIVIGVAIIGIIGGAIATSVTQVFSGSNISSNEMTAVNNVRNAGDWITRDAQQAQIWKCTIGSGVLLASPDKIYLHWFEYNDTEHEVEYTLAGTDLKRVETIDGVTGIPVIIARNIMAVTRKLDECLWSADVPPVCLQERDILEVTITASVGTGKYQETETRTFEILMRPQR